MTTTAETAAVRPILALDLGKYKSVACLYHAAADHQCHAFATHREASVRLLARHRPAGVLLEACLLAGWVCDLCAAQGVPCLVANTSSEAWKFKPRKRKTDRDDALRLAEVYALGTFPSVAIPVKPVRARRALIELRQKLVGRRVAVQNRLRAILVGQGLRAPRGAAAWSTAGLDGFAAHAKPLADCGPEELWRGRLHRTLAELHQVRELEASVAKKLDELGKHDQATQRLETIPGVGPRTAEAVAAFLPEPARFRTGKQVSA